MPFRSTAQQRFMFSQHPGIAHRWADEMKGSKRKGAKEHPIKAAGLPNRVGKALNSGSFERAGSTAVPMSQPPARRGQMQGTGNVRGSRYVEKREQMPSRVGKAFIPTAVLMQRGQAPSQQQQGQNGGVAGSVMPTLAGQNTGAPRVSAQSNKAANAGATPAQAPNMASQTSMKSTVPTSGQKPIKQMQAVGKADRAPDHVKGEDRIRYNTAYRGRRPRHFDPEARRQRRMGEGIAAAGISGVYGTATGAQRVRRSTGTLSHVDVRGRKRVPVSDIKRVRGAVNLDRNAAGRLGAGAAGLITAGALMRRANDPRNRRWT